MTIEDYERMISDHFELMKELFKENMTDDEILLTVKEFLLSHRDEVEYCAIITRHGLHRILTDILRDGMEVCLDQADQIRDEENRHIKNMESGKYEPSGEEKP